MAGKVSAEPREDLLQAIRERYRGGLKEEELRILDEFVAVTGYHRKHVIRLCLGSACSTQRGFLVIFLDQFCEPSKVDRCW